MTSWNVTSIASTDKAPGTAASNGLFAAKTAKKRRPSGLLFSCHNEQVPMSFAPRFLKMLTPASLLMVCLTTVPALANDSSAVPLQLKKELEALKGTLKDSLGIDDQALSKIVATAISLKNNSGTPKHLSLQIRINQALKQNGLGQVRYVNKYDQAYWSAAASHYAESSTPGDQRRWIGAQFDTRGKYRYVTHVFKGSPAEQAGLKRGDKILTVNGDTAWRPAVTFALSKPAALHELSIQRLPWGKPKRKKQIKRVDKMK